MLKRKVYILDHELISPIAIGAENIIDSIHSNYCAEDTISSFSVKGLPFSKAAEVKADLSSYYSKESDKIKEACKYDRKLALLAACYGKASKRIEPLISLLDSDKTGIILGVGADVTPFELYEEEIASYIKSNHNPITELFTQLNDNQSRINLAGNPYDFYAIYLANKFNAGAFQKSVLTACVSSTQAIALGYDAIARGDVEVVIAGGTDSLINLLAMISFGKLGVIPVATNEPDCKPFDLNRNGTLAGESAGFTILASVDFLKKHKLNAIAQLLGYGNTLDGYKITAPDPTGESMTQAIKYAMKNAGISANMLSYINAHGTGTKHNDALELSCIGRALGSFGNKVPISSTKDRHGHAIAAAGIQEFCVLMELMKNSVIPGNLNLKVPCNSDFNLVRENKAEKIEYALSSNFAFGGINTVLAVKNEIP